MLGVDLVEVGHGRAAVEREQEARAELEAVVEGEDREDPVVGADLEQAPEGADLLAEGLVAEEDALAGPSRARGVDQRGWGPRHELVLEGELGEPLQAALLDGSHEVLEGRNRDVAVLAEAPELVADGGVAEGREEDLLGSGRVDQRQGAVGLGPVLEGDAGRAGELDREVAHAPLGGVLAEDRDSVVGLDSGRAQASAASAASRAALLVGHPIDDLALGVEASPHHDGAEASPVLEERGQGRKLRLEAARGAALLEAELREGPALEARNVDLVPVAAPVDLTREVGDLGLVDGVQPFVEPPRVVAAEGHGVGLDEWQVDLDDHHGPIEVPGRGLDLGLDRMQEVAQARLVARLGDPVHEVADLLDELGLTRQTHPLIESSRDHHGVHVELAPDVGPEVALLALAIGQRSQLDDPAHREGVRVAGPELIDGLLDPRDGVGRDPDQGVSHVVDGDHVQGDLRGRGPVALAEGGHPDQGRAGVDPLVPAREGEADGALDDGRTNRRHGT